MPFFPAPYEDVLSLLIQITLLLFFAKAFGELSMRLGQPSVIGEIFAGIILGPSVLGIIFPSISSLWIPSNEIQGYLLETISLLGAIFLLTLTGLETDLKLIRIHAKTALSVSITGIAATTVSGFILGMNLPAELAPDESKKLILALFLAISLAISSIPVIATVLLEMKLIRRDIGQTIIAAGMSDDTIGWIFLTIVVGLAHEANFTLLNTAFAAGTVLFFLLASFTAGGYLVKKSVDFVQDKIRLPDRLFTLVIIFSFMWSAFAHILHLEAVLGAFVAGIILGRIPQLPNSVHRRLEGLAFSVFTPLFFAAVGLKINILHILKPELLFFSAAIIAVATVSKIAGTYAGARIFARKDHWTSLSFGAGLNARGAMQVIIATIGYESGILNQDMFTIIILMALATSIMAPPALRWTLKKVIPDEKEKHRLQLEELFSASLFAGIKRVLLPVRYREGNTLEIQSIEAHILDRLRSGTDMSVTLMCVTAHGEESKGMEFLTRIANVFGEANIKKKSVSGSDAPKLILEEAKKDYNLLILGAPRMTGDNDMLFSPIVDQIIRSSPCPTMVVQGHIEDPDWNPKNIFVPTNGTSAGKIAAEVAFSIASEEKDDIVTIFTAVKEYQDDWHIQTGMKWGRRFISARQITGELREMGEMLGIRTRTLIKGGDDVSKTILDTSRDEKMDLIVLGTDIRPGSQRLFLGPTVERILRKSPCPVIVINAS